MKRPEAQAEARKRWGPLAFAKVIIRDHQRLYVVGIHIVYGQWGINEYLGRSGCSWEQAFTDSETTIQKLKEEN